MIFEMAAGATKVADHSSAPWLGPLVSAVIGGGLVALLIDRALSQRAARAAFRSALALLHLEVTAIEGAASQPRRAIDSGPAISAPLDSGAWTSLVTLGGTRWLSPETLTTMGRFYGLVADANATSALTPHLFFLAQLAAATNPVPAVAELSDIAATLPSSAQARVAAALPEARKVLDGCDQLVAKYGWRWLGLGKATLP